MKPVLEKLKGLASSIPSAIRSYLSTLALLVKKTGKHKGGAKQGKNVNPQLSIRLKKALLLTLLAVLVLATIAAAITAYLETSDVQDETLRSVAKLVNTNQVNTQFDEGRRSRRSIDDSAIRIWDLDKSASHGLELEKNLSEGFDTVIAKGEVWRVLVIKHPDSQKRYAIVQKRSVSAELALQSAKNTAMPLLLLFLLVPLLITLIVRHSFKPLNKLSEKISASDSLTLDLSNDAEIPVEVLPFVSAIDALLENNEAYNKQQRRFIADAAHELRTPITALSLEIDNVNKSKDEHTKQERQTALSHSVARLQRLVNQLLDLARAQSLGDDNIEVVSLNDLVSHQIAELYVLAEEKDIELSVSRNEPAQLEDRNSQLQHLLRNAITNAIKFAPENGQIKIEVFREGDQAVFNVVDNGPGVAEEHLDQLKEPFYRPAEQASNSGAGLGLAICTQIAMKLDGQLTFENVEPSGFRFTYSQASNST